MEFKFVALSYISLIELSVLMVFSPTGIYLLIQNQRGYRFGAYIFTAYLLFIFNKYSSIANRMDWLRIKRQPSETLNK